MGTCKTLLAIAAGEIGVRESPPGSNRVRYNTWYYGREVSGSGYPWCMAFVQWCFAQAGVALPKRTASCGDLMRAAQAAGRWVTGDYRPGDVAIYDFPGGAAADHCGIVSQALPDGVRAIEGNTGGENDADGGQVMERQRPGKYVLGAVRPDYEEEAVMRETRYSTVSECPDWAKSTVEKLVRGGFLNGGGDGLDLSYDMVRLLVILDRAGALGA